MQKDNQYHSVTENCALTAYVKQPSKRWQYKKHTLMNGGTFFFFAVLFNISTILPTSKPELQRCNDALTPTPETH